MSDTGFSCIILAAGRGTRMSSPLPKILHPVAGVPMIGRVVQAVQDAGSEEVRVVVGYGEQLVRQVLEPLGVQAYKQANQFGTADAVKAAEPSSMRGTILILNGDHPLITQQDIEGILKQFKDSRATLGLVTAELENPGDFGRVVRHKGELKAIVEARDASADTLAIKEVNTGIYVVRAAILNQYLPRIKNHNAKNEYYLTDLISLCIEGRESVVTLKAPPHVAYGVNTQSELSGATKRVFKRKLESLMEAGVMVLDTDSTYVEDSVQVGAASVLYPGVYLKGKSKLGQYCVVEPNCMISDSLIEDSVIIRAGTYLEGTTVKTKATLGPYARLRPGTEIGVEAHVGNFVEMKKVKFGDHAKAGHLTYLGDAQVGEHTNIGCGTITCNYAPDRQKYRTVIGKNVFVGSDTQFIAPITIGDGAVIGSGSTITKPVPENALAVARGKQVIKENYVPKQASKEEE
ncbi:MAG TPA: bifunctional UDP-N-acetylglucosamine diphosphorylase/glucosamine-1-phosphate N-acetyltransferase GlmU [Bdellovibrionales bacterium]|nr:bifunctional UDP-N-acetylglucosamine diphosphorylase/glucosamine-1-phosphate N-acetyltransferase GlmU [Bdellovibrionales bacterium]